MQGLQNLQELKNLIYDIEEELRKDGLSASEVALQLDATTYVNINLYVNTYLSNVYVQVISKELM